MAARNGGERQPLVQHEQQQQQQPLLAPLSPGLNHHQHQQSSPLGSSSSAYSAGGPTFSSSLYPIYNDPFSLDNLRRADKRARRRAMFTVVLGFMMWTILGLLVTIIGGEGAGLLGDSRPSWSRNRWPGPLPRQPTQDGNITSSGCADLLKTLPSSVIRATGKEETKDLHTLYKTKSYFHFEVDESDGVFLLGRGRYSNGPVHVIVEEPKSHKAGELASDKPIVEIEVMAIWNDKDLLKTVKVCPLSREANRGALTWPEYGVGIYTPAPEYTEPGKRLSFETIIRLPPSSSKLQSLTVHGQNFYPLSVAASPISFARVDLSSVNGVVTIPEGYQLAGDVLYAYASNGKIDGTFNVSSDLRLESQNGPIKADINLLAKKGYQNPISVTATTSNGYVDLNYLQHPQNVVLLSTAKTSNGDAKVRHLPAFEGDFSVSSYRFFPSAQAESARSFEHR